MHCRRCAGNSNVTVDMFDLHISEANVSETPMNCGGSLMELIQLCEIHVFILHFLGFKRKQGRFFFLNSRLEQALIKVCSKLQFQWRTNGRRKTSCNSSWTAMWILSNSLPIIEALMGCFPIFRHITIQWRALHVTPGPLVTSNFISPFNTTLLESYTSHISRSIGESSELRWCGSFVLGLLQLSAPLNLHWRLSYITASH